MELGQGNLLKKMYSYLKKQGFKLPEYLMWPKVKKY